MTLRVVYLSSLARLFTGLRTAAAPLYSASNCSFLLLFSSLELTRWMMQCLSRLTIFLLSSLLFLLSPNTTRAQQYYDSPVIPLAVRSPYLNCWLQYNKTSTATIRQTWPTAANFSQVCRPNISCGHQILNLLFQTLGWSFLIRVDNETYPFLGDVDPDLINDSSNSTGYSVGPTSTIVTGRAGPMLVNLTFLNPIEVSFTPLLISMSTYASCKASRLGQTIHPILVYVFYRKVIGRRES